jgi:hypothetical protein
MKVSSCCNGTDAHLGLTLGPRGIITSRGGRVPVQSRGICGPTEQLLESRGHPLQAVTSPRIVSPWLQLLYDTLLEALGVSIEFDRTSLQNQPESSLQN